MLNDFRPAPSVFLETVTMNAETAKYLSSILPGSFLLCMDGDETALAEAAVNSLRRREE